MLKNTPWTILLSNKENNKVRTCKVWQSLLVYDCNTLGLKLRAGKTHLSNTLKTIHPLQPKMKLATISEYLVGGRKRTLI